MTEADPLTLPPGERVLWQGRAALGAPRTPWRTHLTWTALIWAVMASPFLAMALHGPPGAGGEGLALVTLGALWVLTLVTLGQRLGPFHGSYVLLGLLGPGLVHTWTSLVSTHGWDGALEVVGPAPLGAQALIVAVPLARIAVGVTARLGIIYVVTDRRVAAVRHGVLLWRAPRDGLAAGPADVGPCLVLGERTLHLRDDDPARVLDAVARG